MALGQPLNIPIIIRTLAGTLAFADENYLPFRTMPGFLDILDVGTHQIVPNFELQWWTEPETKDISTVKILNARTVMVCLAHFREQKKNTPVLPAGARAGSSNISNAGSNAGSTTPIPTSARSQCESCMKYQQLLSDVLQDVLEIQKYASVRSTSSENLLNMGIRRASTFHQLHEAAILKESEGVSPPAKKKPAAHIAAVLRNAELELDRLKGLPSSSYKWTWGETLTEEEVLNLRRIGTRPGKVPHSGYDISLREAPLRGEDSAGPSSVRSSLGQHEDLPAEATIGAPSTDLEFPEFYRSNPDHRLVYNPFKISNSLSINVAPDTSDNLQMAEAWEDDENGDHFNADTSTLDVVDKWSFSSSGKTSSTHPGEIAATWTSGSEGGRAQAPPTGDVNDILQMADAWEGDKEDGKGLRPVAESGAIQVSSAFPATQVNVMPVVPATTPVSLLLLRVHVLSN